MSNGSSRKVSLVGTGLVGSSFAYALMILGLASELVLIDRDTDRAAGEMMDFNHGLSFTRPMKITAGDYADCAGSHVVVIAAGASQKPGESRLDLLARNAAIFREIVPQVVRHNHAIGLGLLSIVAAILGDYRRVVSVSTLMTGQHGVEDMCLSLPCVVGAHGVEEILTLNLDPAEESGLGPRLPS